MAQDERNILNNQILSRIYPDTLGYLQDNKCNLVESEARLRALPFNLGGNNRPHMAWKRVDDLNKQLIECKENNNNELRCLREQTNAAEGRNEVLQTRNAELNRDLGKAQAALEIAYQELEEVKDKYEREKERSTRSRKSRRH